MPQFHSARTRRRLPKFVNAPRPSVSRAVNESTFAGYGTGLNPQTRSNALSWCVVVAGLIAAAMAAPTAGVADQSLGVVAFANSGSSPSYTPLYHKQSRPTLSSTTLVHCSTSTLAYT